MAAPGILATFSEAAVAQLEQHVKGDNEDDSLIRSNDRANANSQVIVHFTATVPRHLRVAFLPFGPITLKSVRSKPYKESPVTIGEHLRKKRCELGLFQKDVAGRLKVGGWTYLSWEQDRKKPSVRFMPRIIGFLGLDPLTADGSIGSLIRAKRRILGLSQEKAAKLLGIDEGTFRQYEQGLWQPKGTQLIRIRTFIQSGVAEPRE